MKLTPRRLCGWLASGIFAAGTLPATAQSDLWNSARERLVSLQSGKAPKSEPVHAQGAVEQWGDPMPTRGDDAERRAAERIRARDAKPQGTAAPARVEVRREQRADERAIDDRHRDERNIDPRNTDAREVRANPRRPVEDAEDSPAPARPAPKAKAVAKPKLSAEERLYGQRLEAEPQAARASCVNVSRAWEGAAALAERGEDQRAYDAYMRLLGSCTNDKELVGTVYQAQKHLSSDALAQLMAEPLMESPKLQAALYSLKLQRMYAANKAGNGKQALALSRELRAQVLDSGDAGALEVSGWLEQRSRNSKAAEQLFRAALKANHDAEAAREGLVFALLAQGKLEAASREADRLEAGSADEVRAEVLLAQARAALEDEQPAETLKLLDKAERLGLNVDDSVMETRAWALKNSGQHAKAAKIFIGLVDAQPDNADLATGLADSLAAARDETSLKKLAAGSGAVAQASREALSRKLGGQGRRVEAARLRGETVEGDGPSAGAVVAVRSKSGDKGEGKLTETIVPALAADMRVNETTRVQVEASRLRLDDGVHEERGTEVRARVKAKIDDVEVTAGAGVSQVNGSSKPTFEAKARVYTENGHVEAGVSREPVRDSVRSYAGVDVEVPKQGGSQTIRVGRAFDTNAYIGGSSVLDHINRYNISWQVGGGSVSGTNTPNNGYYRATAAVTKDIEDERFSWLNVGPYVAFQAYDRDENQFASTSGGYFSPKSDIGMGMQLKALTREGGSTLFKTDAKLGYVSRTLSYGTDSGVAVEGGTEGAWLLGEHLIVGAGVNLRTSPGYSDVGVRFGLNVPFEKRTKLYGSDLTSFRAQ